MKKRRNNYRKQEKDIRNEQRRKPYLERTTAVNDRVSLEKSNISKHKGNPEEKLSMEFLVRWTDNFCPVSESWLPYHVMRDNVILHQYLVKHDLSHVIPKRHLATYSVK